MRGICSRIQRFSMLWGKTGNEIKMMTLSSNSQHWRQRSSQVLWRIPSAASRQVVRTCLPSSVWMEGLQARHQIEGAHHWESLVRTKVVTATLRSPCSRSSTHPLTIGRALAQETLWKESWSHKRSQQPVMSSSMLTLRLVSIALASRKCSTMWTKIYISTKRCLRCILQLLKLSKPIWRQRRRPRRNVRQQVLTQTWQRKVLRDAIRS